MANKRALFHTLMSVITPFQGEENEDVRLFLKNITDICEIQSVSSRNRVTLLRLLCKGKALDFISNDKTVSEETDFEKVSQLFIKKFEKKVNFQESSALFAKLTQKPGQSVKNFAEEITNIVNNMSPDATGNHELEKFKSHLMISKFTENIRSDIKVELLKFGLQNFNELVEKAVHIENALNQREFDVNNIISTPSTSSDSFLFNSILEQQTTQSKQIEELTLTIKKLKEEKLSCQICGKNHSAKDCWHFLGSQNNFQAPNLYSNPPNQQNDESRGRGRGNFRGFQNSRGFNRGRGRNFYRPYNRSRNLNY